VASLPSENNRQEERRKQLKEAMRSNPDAVINLILSLEKAYRGI
jgi:hypothetical protein